ncbi:WXG100 family type VII secretion target [Mycobacterium sp. PSTR-4-N]|uniref:WXG100 family type VII secretion target n=1 Tax=Mycobacterium sp. PSTR-4-N TaxID=2917745 RepID=UPI001F14A8B0|nr:WXG100 family type VII secretion target [Mycobacterium sp. PSTR-4-N]MCG7594956.1 WXG100 family type VII secretion target [Mycobacterium sp. PSTR-4-N]
MSRLQVSTSELVAVSSELDTLAQSLKSGLGSLDADISDALGAGWSGDAATAYGAVWRDWHEGAAQVIEGLTRMSSLLQDAAERYSATDATSGDDISGVVL